MSSCLSSRACGFDLEHMVKWPCSTSGRTTSNSSSPSSTLSESSDAPMAISTRKPRTPRKRPNQTYNEAAALFSMACPNIFRTKHLTKLPNFTKHHANFFNQPSELILPFPVIENSGFLLRQRIMDKPCSLIQPKVASSCRSSGEIKSNSVSVELSDGDHDDLDTESMLDEETEQGIDSIMGDSNSILEIDESNDVIASHFNTCHGYPMGLGFGGTSELNFGFVMRNGVKALRKADERNFWSLPAVKMVNISPPPPLSKSPVGKKKNKKKKVEDLMKSGSEFRQGNYNPGDESSSPENGHRFILKLDYDAILNAWSDKGSPMPEEIPQSADIHARAAHIDLFSENGRWRESGATRSTHNNHFKKIRYRVKNASSDRRPRCKGRFVTKPNSPTWDEET